MYRIDKLLKLDNKLFHTQDLAVIWDIKNKNTLYTTIKRYVQKGILIPVHKGFYSTIPLQKIDPQILGVGYLHRYTYLSCESILFNNGIISQPPQTMTLISSVSVKFTLAKNRFMVRRLAPKFLNQTTGITQNKTLFFATTERAVADTLYFQPSYYFDNRLLLDWKKIKEIQKEVGYL